MFKNALTDNYETSNNIFPKIKRLLSVNCILIIFLMSVE